MRTAEEIRRTARAWVEVYWLPDLMNVVSGKSFSYRLKISNGKVAFTAVTEFILEDSATSLAIEIGKEAGLPVLYDTKTLYDPPDRLAALRQAGDALAEAADWLIDATERQRSGFAIEMEEWYARRDTGRARLAAWRKAREA